MDYSFLSNNILVIPLVVLELVLKGFGLWRSAKDNQKYWFIAILLINSLGILPAVYLLIFQNTPAIKLNQPNSPVSKQLADLTKSFLNSLFPRGRNKS